MQLSVSTQGHGSRALVFLHQACGSARAWDNQLNDPLFEQYTRISIELPGHGASLPAEAYSLPALGSMLSRTLQQLQPEEYVLVTLSIGGCIAVEALPELNGCKGLFITGGCLLGGPVTPATLMRPFEYGMALFEADPPEERLQNYVAGLIATPVPGILQALATDYRNTDPAFRTGLAGSLSRGEWSDQIAHVEKAALPVAFVYGEKEQIVDGSYLEIILPLKWCGAVQVLPAAGHLANLDQPAEFNRLLARFLRDQLF